MLTFNFANSAQSWYHWGCADYNCIANFLIQTNLHMFMSC